MKLLTGGGANPQGPTGDPTANAGTKNEVPVNPVNSEHPPVAKSLAAPNTDQAAVVKEVAEQATKNTLVATVTKMLKGILDQFGKAGEIALEQLGFVSASKVEQAGAAAAKLKEERDAAVAAKYTAEQKLKESKAAANLTTNQSTSTTTQPPKADESQGSNGDNVSLQETARLVDGLAQLLGGDNKLVNQQDLKLTQ